MSRPATSHARYVALFMLFAVSTINYADRATLSIAGSEVSKELGLSKIAMGYAFSAFGWAYVIGQIPGGWLLDRFGSKRVYAWSIIAWSVFTFLQGFIGVFETVTAIVVLFRAPFHAGRLRRCRSGTSRIVVRVVSAGERGTVRRQSSIPRAFATAMFAPITAGSTFRFLGWPCSPCGRLVSPRRSSDEDDSTVPTITRAISAAESRTSSAAVGLRDMIGTARARRWRPDPSRPIWRAARQPDAAGHAVGSYASRR